MEEGIRFAECLAPEEVEVDRFGHAAALAPEPASSDGAGKIVPTGERVDLPARTILVAAGTQPNTVLAREDPRTVDARRPLLPGRRRGRQPGQAGARRQARRGRRC